MVNVHWVVLAGIFCGGGIAGAVWATAMDFFDWRTWMQRARTATAHLESLEDELTAMEVSGAKDLHEVLVEADQHGLWAALHKLRKLRRAH